MNSLTIFKSTFVNALRSSIPANLDKYLRDDVWVSESSTRSAREMQTNVELAGPLSLEFPVDSDHKDTENAIRFHRELRHLTPLQARDPRLWTRLAHVELWPYMRLRWDPAKHMAKRDRAARFVESRYFVAQSQSRALLRHGIARLWWTAQLSHDSDRENPYELTTVLLSTLDITQQIVERGMGRASNIIRGFLAFLLANGELLLTGGDKNRARIRRLAKHLNMYGGVCVLDLLSQAEVTDVLAKEFDRIRVLESTGAEGEKTA
ncbi:MAG: hypothetical protein JW909_05485 [Planctomycetes bacterium]|nr:hypothetical protein [Planctomycetota bacterium]